MTASLNKTLLENLHTKEDLDLLVSEIAMLTGSLFKSPEEFKRQLTSGISSTTAQFIEKTIKVDADPKDILTQLRELAKLLKTIQTVYLTFAFEPTEEAVENIHHWLLKNMTNSYVLEIKYDPRILGGVIIEYNGKFGDYSLRSRVDKYLKDNKNQILERVKGEV